MGKVFSFKWIVVIFLIGSSLFFIRQYHHLVSFRPEVLGKYFPVKWFLFGHIMPAGIALVTGPLQFIKSFRQRSWKLHRLLGKLYVICIGISAFCALYLSMTTTFQTGIMYTVSIWFMLAVWVTATFMAYYTIRKKKVQEHEEWMTRSYITTFAFIVQNYIIKIPAIMALGPFPEVSPNMFWFSWAVPLFVYQVYLTQVKMNKSANRPAKQPLI